jgi:chromosome segregation ATPase
MKKTCAAVLAIGMAILWAGGCQEEQASSGDKMARLMALENRDLKTQLQQETKKRDDEIKNLKTQFQAEMKKRDDEIKNLKTQFQVEMKKRDDVNRLTEKLAQCEQAKQKSIKAQEEEQKRLESLISDWMDGNTELVAKVEQLKAELSNCEKKK